MTPRRPSVTTVMTIAASAGPNSPSRPINGENRNSG